MQTAPPLLVLIHHNRPDLTSLALHSLRRHTAPPHRLLVIDNASGDDRASWPVLAASELLVNPAPLSFAANCNLGLARAAGGAVVLLNNDLYFPPGWLEGLFGGLAAGLGVVGAISNFELPLNLALPPGRLTLPAQAEPADLPDWAWPTLDQVLGAYNQGARERPPRPRPFVSFYAVAIAAQVVAELGGLHEGFVQGCEDLDYCLAAWRAGWRVGQAPGAYVVHFSGRATQADAAALARRDGHNLPLLLERWPQNVRSELARAWDQAGLAAEGAQLWQGLEDRWRRLSSVGQ